MSYRIVGYLDGRRIVVNEGESRARVTGWGGTFAQHATPLMGPIAQPRWRR